MREIEIGGKKFQVRSLRLKERREQQLDQYGYGRFFYKVAQTPGGEPDQDKIEAGMDKVLSIVFSKEDIDQIDMLGGQHGLNVAHRAIIDETYGVKDEEKNSSASGAGPQTKSE